MRSRGELRARDLILLALESGPATTVELIRATTQRRGRVHAALVDLQADGRVVGFRADGRWLWRLPDGGRDWEIPSIQPGVHV